MEYIGLLWWLKGLWLVAKEAVISVLTSLLLALLCFHKYV